MKRPNIILISIDTLRADHLSCYGYERKTTPNLDRIASEGILFKNAYSTAVWTPPAHASMLTGLYPSQHGVIDENRLNNDIPFIAEILQQYGYQTAGFVNNPAVGKLTGLHRGYETFYEIWKGLSSSQIFQRVVFKIKESSGYTDNFADKTNKLVKSWLKSKRNPEKPFYIFIHYIEPHNPLRAPKPFYGSYLNKRLINKVDMRKIGEIAKNPLICLTDNMKLHEDEIEALTCLYDEEIAYIDYKIGELIEYLRAERLLDNTLFIITADHGEHLGEKGLYSHVASLYEPIIHIPLIIRYPELIEPSLQNEALVQLIDIVPTIIHAAGLNVKSFEFSGTPLLPIKKEFKYHDYIIAEWEGRIPHFVKARLRKLNKINETDKYTSKLVMVRKDAYKFIRSSNGQEELFDLNQDRAESNNIVSDNQEIASELGHLLADWQSILEYDKEIVNNQYSLDKVTTERLKALGYL